MENYLNGTTVGSRMRKSVLLLVLAMTFLFTITFSTASEDYPDQKVDVNFSFCQICANANYITLSSILTPTTNEVLNVNMTDLGGGQFCYNYTPTEIGRYDFMGISDGCVNTYAIFVDVTVSGETVSMSRIVAHVSLMVLFALFGLAFYLIVSKFDFEAWHNAILKKYETRNIVKMVLSAILYNIMMNSYMIYYLIGFPIIMIAVNIAYVYNISAIVDILNALLLVYSIGVIIVGLVFLSHIQEWIANMLELVKNMDWGIDR